MFRPFKDKRPNIVDSSVVDSITGDGGEPTEVGQGRGRMTEEQQVEELERIRGRDTTEPPGSSEPTTAPPNIPSSNPTPTGTFVVDDFGGIEDDVGTCYTTIVLSYDDSSFPSKINGGVGLYDISEDMLKEFGGWVSEEADIEGSVIYPGFISEAEKGEIAFVIFTRFWSITRETIDGIVDGSVMFLDSEFGVGEPLAVSMVAHDTRISDMVDEYSQVEHEHMIKL